MKKIITRIFIIFIASLVIQQFSQQETQACDVAVITASASATGRPFIWKNRDHGDSYRHVMVYKAAVNSSVGGCFKLMGETKFNTTSSPATTCSGGANESGFAIANTTVYDTNDPLDMYNVNTNLVEKALEECRTLAEFETIAKNYTSYWSSSTISGNFAVIDAYGGAAIYEMWSNGRGKTLMYRKFDVNTGTVTRQDGSTAIDNSYSAIETVGFNNRTNSFHTANWKEINSDTPREFRASQLFTRMLQNDQLSPRNVMRYVSKDVCGDNSNSLNVYDRNNMSAPVDYFYDSEVYLNRETIFIDRDLNETAVTNIWDENNSDDDLYTTPNYDGEMFTAYCISRYQTTMGLVIEGAATAEQAKLTTMWVALGEPSMSVFIPFFPYSRSIAPYATDNVHNNSGYYWDGVSATSNTKPTCFLNLLFDCVEANPFSSSNDLYDIYSVVSIYKNNGSGLIDNGERTNGSSTVMDTTINYPKLLNVQAWAFPLEDYVLNGADRYLSVLLANPSLITRESLAEFSYYNCKYVYENYCSNLARQADSLPASFTTWSHELPDDGLNPTVVSVDPSNGASGFEGRVPVTVTFSEPVDQSTVSSATFTVLNGSTAVAGSYEISSAAVTFTPDSALANNTAYTVQITTGIKDLAGKNMTSGFSSVFTTKDDISPAVSSVNPSYGSVNQPVDTTISVVFSEDVYGTVDSSTFMLMNGSTAVSGTVTYEALSRTAVFTPAAALDYSTLYTVVLSTAIQDLSGNSLAYYSSTFTTAAYPDTVSPAVTSVDPCYGGINPSVDTAVTVVFSEDVYGTVDGSTFRLLKGSTPVSGSVTYDQLSRTAVFTPSSALEYSTTYTVELTSGIKDAAGNSLSAYTTTFTTVSPVDTIAPVVTSVDPCYGGINPSVDTAVTVVFSEDVYGTVDGSTFKLMKGSAPVSGSVAYDQLSRTATFTPASALEYSTTYTIYLTSGIKDPAGNSLADYSSIFTTAAMADVIAPAVSSINPAYGGVNPPVTTAVTVEFSEAVDETTVTAATFMLMNGASAVSGTVHYDAILHTATFTPGSGLDYSTVYTVVLTSGIKDLAGNSLSGYSSTFTTASKPDVTAPAVNSFSPDGNGSINPPVNTAITVAFSEAIDKNTITTDTFKLMNGTAAVTGSITYNELTFTAVFTPSAALAYSTLYTITLTSGIRDLSGNSLAACSSTFTTLAVPDTVSPSVLSVDPADGADNPPVTNAITVKFSEPVDVTTINTNTFMLLKNGSEKITGTIQYDSLLYKAVFTPNSVLEDNSTYTVRLTTGIKDLSGNSLSPVFLSTFAITTPAVLTVNTGNGGAVFPVNGSISVQFSEDMDPGSITTGTFIVFNGSGAVSGSVTYNAETRTAVFTPDEKLSYYTTYTVDLTTGILSSDGKSLADDITWTFMTAADGVIPSVTDINPADKTVKTPVNIIISATFNKIMSKGTITRDSFKVTSADGSETGSVAYDSVTNIAAFTPAGSLKYNTLYTVELTSDIQDTQGQSLADTKWTFTTESGFVESERKTAGSGGGCGCGTAAEAASYGSGPRSLLPGLFSLMGTMLFPLSLIWLHRKSRRRFNIHK